MASWPVIYLICVLFMCDAEKRGRRSRLRANLVCESPLINDFKMILRIPSTCSYNGLCRIKNLPAIIANMHAPTVILAGIEPGSTKLSVSLVAVP